MTQPEPGAPTAEEQRCRTPPPPGAVGPYLSERRAGHSARGLGHSDSGNADYFYLDSTLTHSYRSGAVPVSAGGVPYSDLVQTNRQRTRAEMEYELLDTTA
jgi:hypothetical protein